MSKIFSTNRVLPIFDAQQNDRLKLNKLTLSLYTMYAIGKNYIFLLCRV